MSDGNHFDNVDNWLNDQQLSRDDVTTLLKCYQEQHERPFKESNRFYVASLILASLFFFDYFGIEFSIEIFELDFLDIPNGQFFLPVLSISCLAYSALRAAGATYYQHLIEVIAKNKLADTQKVVARGYFGGGIIFGNVLDVWRSIPGAGFKFWYFAFVITSALPIIGMTLLPYVTGIFFLFWVDPVGTPVEAQTQQAIMGFILMVGISAGGYALSMQSLGETLVTKVDG